MLQFPELWMNTISLGERIANELRLKILENSIKPGEVLSENQIAQLYGTSRSPVRDAMKALSNDGLIHLERMGAVVLGLSQKDVQELYDIREMIENFAQQRVSRKDMSTVLHSLCLTIDQMELAARYDMHSNFAYYDLTFHETIIRHARHQRILNLWNGMRPLIMAIILVTTEDVFAHGTEHTEWVIDKHRKIVRAMQTGTSETIEKSVGRYFDDSKRTLNKSFPLRIDEGRA
ncbi:GntR family transcriptional regulator [Sporolactobacillus kofuensis]|uniref:GntR family transcriptional regulator n=1 Tax=Sporolactobacillus kofuensis TaxID=269672 RepID=A0ABW1WB43_9BACL|nr:GntR family transcriptional regulator [Sporolactobacillus kofuensis]MCO7174783.1 GntR family transcriptional regulator [Sporolactobacillus kofuensis]